MIYILFIILVLMLLFNYFVNNNILIPSFILTLSFSLVTFVYVICTGAIPEPISINTLLIIVFSIMAYCMGEMISIGLINRGNLERKCVIQRAEEDAFLSINGIVVVLLAGIVFAAAYIRFMALCNAVGTSTSITSFLSSYATIRFYIIHGMSPVLPGWINLISIVGPCIVKICITIFTYNIVRYRIVQKRYFLIFAVYFFYLITTTSRTVYLEILLYTVFQFVFLRLFITEKQPKISWELLRLALIALVIFAVIFIVIGNLADKSGSFIKTLFAYSAAGFVGLNQYIAKPYYSPGILYSRTIRGLLSPFDNFGLVLPEIDEFLPHYYYLGGAETSNEYTSLMEPIYDFGILGMLITRLLLGMAIVAIFYYIISKSNNIRKYFVIPMFVPMYYALTLAAIDDQFQTFFGVYYIYQVVFTWIMWKVCVKYIGCTFTKCQVQVNIL